MRSLLGSVRVRTTLAATVLTALVLAIASIVIVQLVERDLLDRAGSNQPLNEVQEGVDAVSNALLLIVPGLVLVLGAATWFMVGRALRPVQAISDQVATITATTLDERVPEPAGRDEVAALARLMNQMLDRLEEGAQRQRQFIADASHELRSPLSTIKAAAEVAQVSPDPHKLGQLAGDLGAEADRMEELIADLLDLARLDEQSPPGIEDVVDLDKLCRRAADRISTVECPVEVVSTTPVFVPGVESQLERAIFNVVLNGAQHASRAVHVRIQTRVGRGQVVVDDDGPGIDRENRNRVFERFVRLDGSRERNSGGAGIGLSLVKAIVARHGGTVHIAEAPELGGARFVLDLGIATQPAVAGDPTGEPAATHSPPIESLDHTPTSHSTKGEQV